MASQRRLGIWSIRSFGYDIDYYTYFDADRQNLVKKCLLKRAGIYTSSNVKFLRLWCPKKLSEMANFYCRKLFWH